MVLVVGGIYVALQHVPHFYEQALDQQSTTQQQANDVR